MKVNADKTHFPSAVSAPKAIFDEENAEIADPNLNMCRNERQDPSVTASNVDCALPSLTNERTDIVDPSSTKAKTEALVPSR
jgi:hypothetical protein